MANKYFNVKTGIKTGNIVLDATSGNVNVANLIASNLMSAADLMVSGNVRSNLVPNNNAAYNLGASAQTYKDLFLSGNITIANQTISADSTNVNISGTLVVSDANIGNITANNFTTNVANANTINVNNQININSSTNSISTNTGSLITQGGVGIQKDLFVGGAIHLADGVGGTTSKSSIKYNNGVSSIDFNFDG
jgi:hypothetical protein